MQSDKCKCKARTGFINQIRFYDDYNRFGLFWVQFRTPLHWLIDLFKSILSKSIVYLVKLTLKMGRKTFL